MLINKEKITYLIANKSHILYKILVDDIVIKPSSLVSIAELLKQSNYLLIPATSIDHIQKYNRFLLTYIFINYSLAQRIYVSLNTNLTGLSIVHLFSSAIWLEREIYDLFGVFFVSHTSSIPNDLRRILTDYHFKGHPLRKDFALIGYSEKHYSYQTKSIQNRIDFSF